MNPEELRALLQALNSPAGSSNEDLVKLLMPAASPNTALPNAQKVAPIGKQPGSIAPPVPVLTAPPTPSEMPQNRTPLPEFEAVAEPFIPARQLGAWAGTEDERSAILAGLTRPKQSRAGAIEGGINNILSDPTVLRGLISMGAAIAGPDSFAGRVAPEGLAMIDSQQLAGANRELAGGKSLEEVLAGAKGLSASGRAELGGIAQARTQRTQADAQLAIQERQVTTSEKVGAAQVRGTDAEIAASASATMNAQQRLTFDREVQRVAAGMQSRQLDQAQAGMAIDAVLQRMGLAQRERDSLRGVTIAGIQARAQVTSTGIGADASRDVAWINGLFSGRGNGTNPNGEPLSGVQLGELGNLTIQQFGKKLGIDSEFLLPGVANVDALSRAITKAPSDLQAQVRAFLQENEARIRSTGSVYTGAGAPSATTAPAPNPASSALVQRARGVQTGMTFEFAGVTYRKLANSLEVVR